MITMMMILSLQVKILRNLPGKLAGIGAQLVRCTDTSLQWYWYRYIILFCSQLFGPGTMRRKLEPGADWVHCSLHCVSDAHRTPDARVRVAMMMTTMMKRRRRKIFVRYNSDNHHHKPHTNISPSPLVIHQSQYWGFYI